MKINIMIIGIMLSISLTGCNYESTDSKTTKVGTGEDGKLNISLSKNSNTTVHGENNEELLKTDTSLAIESDGTIGNTDVKANMDIDGINNVEDLKTYVNNMVDNQILPLAETSKEKAKIMLDQSLVMSEQLLEKAKGGMAVAGQETKAYVKNWFAETWEEAKAENAAANTATKTNE